MKKKFSLTMILLIFIGIILVNSNNYNKTITNNIKAANSYACTKTDIIWSKLGLSYARGNGITYSEGTINFSTDRKVTSAEVVIPDWTTADGKRLVATYLIWSTYQYILHDQYTINQSRGLLSEGNCIIQSGNAAISLNDENILAILNKIAEAAESYYSIDLETFTSLDQVANLYLARDNWDANVSGSSSAGSLEFNKKVPAYDAIIYWAGKALGLYSTFNLLDYNSYCMTSGVVVDDSTFNGYYYQLAANLKGESYKSYTPKAVNDGAYINSLSSIIQVWSKKYFIAHGRSDNDALFNEFSIENTGSEGGQFFIQYHSVQPTIDLGNLSSSRYYTKLTIKHGFSSTYLFQPAGEERKINMKNQGMELDWGSGSEYYIDWSGSTAAETQAPFGKWDSAAYYTPIKITYEPENCPGHGWLYIYGVDEDHNIVKGKTFEVIGIDNPDYDETFTVEDTNNPIKIQLPYGKYTVIETEVPANYVLNSNTFEVTVSDTPATLEIVNYYSETYVDSTGASTLIAITIGLILIGSGMGLFLYSKQRSVNQI